MKTYFHTQKLVYKVHRSFICNSQRLKATQMSFSGWLVQLWYIHTMNTLYHRTNYCIMGSMFYGLTKLIGWNLIPPCSSLMVFGGGAFGRLLGLDEVWRMGPSLWDWCSSKRGRDARECLHSLFLSLSPPSPSPSYTQRKGQVRTPQERQLSEARKRAFTKNPILPYLDLWLPGSTTMGNTFLLFKPPSL